MTMPAVNRQPDQGVVLVTILIIMALCVTVIVAMTTRSEQATRATARDRDAAQAQALLAAGEASALSALIRDLQNPPEADGPSEPWAQVAQTDTAIGGGRFRLVIRDEAGRFNLNTLAEGSPWARAALRSIAAAAGLPPEVAVRIAAALNGGAPLLQNQDLVSRAGLSQSEISALEPFVTCTPDLNGGVNVNTAPEALLLALLQNADVTARLIERRKTDLITSVVLTDLGIILPAGLTLKSAVFGIRITISSGDAQITADSLIHRWRNPDGSAHAVVAARRLIAP